LTGEGAGSGRQREGGACSGKVGWVERGSPFLKVESKLCFREITRLGADLNVGLISVKC